ncbi:SRPBCC family protein [Ferriphaselus sp. R-1]|uniref:SRPBCC family protein n=1 Tax=Ferriphaselus sp. R-1 TaxID=1485544 RepID=UPI00068A1D06|nr:SRPBCC family protein [Ferriphaselus sp. R-1]
MFKKTVLALVIFLPLVGAYASQRPNELHVERSISIHASPNRIFPLINEFYQWESWTPYNKDPAMKKLFTGSPRGIGASYAWQGNNEVGQGEITITDSVPTSKVVLDLHMIKPIEAHNAVTFTLTPQGDSTQVSWGMDCKMNLLSKVLDTLYILDWMVGKDFEVGLSRLKTRVEQQPTARYGTDTDRTPQKAPRPGIM